MTEDKEILIQCSKPPIFRSRLKFSKFSSIFKIHGSAIFTVISTVISSTFCFIFFPIYLENISGADSEGDGYAACVILVTVLTALFLLVGIVIKSSHLISGTHRRINVFLPAVSWNNIVKIGVSIGLSLLTLCYSWEDQKVLCNLQLPFLGFVFLFASVTHALSRWKNLGYRRTFALLTVIGGVFLSVDYTLVDHDRCRGVHPPPKDLWTWKVHLVWTLAFVVSIWLWVVAMFSLETAIPLPQFRSRRADEGGVRMKVLKVSSLGTFGDHPHSVIKGNTYTYASSDEIYSHVPLLTVYNGLLWFQITTWLVVLSLFWTEFIPGFGKGIRDLEDFNLVLALEQSFIHSIFSGEFWILIISGIVIAHSFTYLLLILRSPLIAIGVVCIAFPIVSLWWSLFQIHSPFLKWMPMLSEMICAILGFPLIAGGTFYLYYLDVFKAQYSNTIFHI